MKKYMLFLLFAFFLQHICYSQSNTILSLKIDGVKDNEWDNFKQDTIGHILENTGYNGKSDLSGYFRMAWDDSAFYLLLIVTDDILFNTSTTGWQNDNVELYFDRKNVKPVSYNGNNFQLSLVRSETAKLSTYSNGVAIQGLNTDAVKYILKNNAEGYTAEFRFSWTSLGYSTTEIPREGTLFGFDIVLCDNDGGARDAILAWNTAKVYNTYETPSVWGSIELFADNQCGVAIHVDEIAPSIPGNLNYTIVDNQILLKWNKSTDNIAVTSYQIYNEYLMLVKSVSDTFCNLPYNSLNEYNFFVSAADAFGNESDISNSVTIKQILSHVNVSGKLQNPYLSGYQIIFPDIPDEAYIYNALGEKLASYEKPSVINSQAFLHGIYILKYKTSTGILQTLKFLIN